MQQAAGCMPAPSQAIQRVHSSRCCSCSYAPVWHRPSQRQARLQRQPRQLAARQAARCPVATYPEPETEKERSPLDYPQVSIGQAKLWANCRDSNCLPGGHQAYNFVLYAATCLLSCHRISSYCF